MNWNDAVLGALRRYASRHNTQLVKRNELIQEEFARISSDTQTTGTTPEQTLSRILQELRDDGVLYFSNRGEYVLIESAIPVENEDLPEDVLDAAINKGALLIGDVPTSDEMVIRRRRRGQRRVRERTLTNYGHQCAFCDVRDHRLLVASHIVRWADDPDIRGNLTNVICMCEFHDPLFEVGYLALTNEFEILRTNGEFGNVIEFNVTVAESFRHPLAFPPNPEFLRRHRRRTGFPIDP